MPPKDSGFKYSFYARTDTGETFSIAELQNVTLTEADEVLDKIDYVRVVRCKDCKHRYVDGENVRYNVCDLNHNKVQADDWFCADAERRENDDH